MHLGALQYNKGLCILIILLINLVIFLRIISDLVIFLSIIGILVIFIFVHFIIRLQQFPTCL